MTGNHDEVTHPAGDERDRLGWWCIAGAELLDALRRAHQGEDPDMVYAELYANSDVTNYGAGGTEPGI